MFDMNSKKIKHMKAQQENYYNPLSILALILSCICFGISISVILMEFTISVNNIMETTLACFGCHFYIFALLLMPIASWVMKVIKHKKGKCECDCHEDEE